MVQIQRPHRYDKDDPKKAEDSRYLHRGKLRWDLQVPAYGFYYLEQILTY